MGFLRPKSRGKGDDAENQRRNRLSKPMTRKSQTNLRTAVKQQTEGQAFPTEQTQPDLDDIVIATPTTADARAKVRSHLFQLDNEFTAVPTKGTQTVKRGVAQLVAQFETAHPTASASQLSLNSQSRRRPMSAVVSSYQLPVATAQNGKRGSLMTSPDYVSSFRTSNLSEDTLGCTSTSNDPFAIPTRRRSNFKPGEATRKLSKPETSTKQADHKSFQPEVNDEDDDTLSLTEGTERELPDISISRPDMIRSDTPRSLERTALGNFSLGSLHIVNGRASPTVSEMSTHLKVQRTPRNRDISSEYADSEAWEDDTVASETSSTGRRTPAGNLRREFSYVAGAEQRMAVQTPIETYEPDNAPVPRTPTRTSPDRASILAQEYMAELPASPFTEIPFSSPVDSVKSAESSGSVVRHTVEKAFTDESLGLSPQQSRTASYGSASSSINSKPSITESKLSSADSRFAQDEVFSSALEFQQSPESPQYHRPVMASKQSDMSDSGYSSNNSVTSAHMEDKIQPPRLETVQEMPKPASKENTPKKLGGFLPMRPALKSRATAPVAPTSPLIRPTTSSTQTSRENTIQSDSPSSKSDKGRNRLRKVKPIHKLWASKPQKEIVVQRNVSAETYDVPEVSPAVLANLNLRSQQLPELEHTVSGHIKSAGSTSSLEPPQDVRFPTPNPEIEEEEEEEDERVTRRSKPRSRSRSRVRSKSRRRSFIEFFTGGDKSEKRKSDVYNSEQEITIDDLGDVVAALGTNPYDVASPNHKPRSMSPDHMQSRSITPHRLSYLNNRPRSMMDDKTASELARTRSKSIHERDVENERRASFGDRSGKPGKPGKLYRANSGAEDMPPMPPMPSEAQLRRMSWRHSRQYSSAQSPQTPGRQWMVESSPQPESSPAPPLPPPHSPRPSFVDDTDVVFEDQEEEDLSLAPPPPCHSPRPVDIVPKFGHDPTPEDPWAAQAQAWKARRQSAGEALRAQWEHHPQSYDEQNAYGEDVSYPSAVHNYPRIPRKPVSRQYYERAENLAPQQNSAWNNQQSHHLMSRPGDSWNGDTYHEYSNSHSDDHRQHYDEQHHDHVDYHDDTYYQGQYGSYHDNQQQQSQYFDSHSQTRSREPSPMPSRALPPRPTSRHSHMSRHSNRSAISLADELHPEDMSRQQPAPEFGRYSGGLQYSYEGREKGFSGSAGTRSVSGKADGAWKGTELRKSCGIDLGDVPIMGTAVRGL